jgi:hypothetical protein
MAEKVEFASPEWFAALRTMFEAYARTAPAGMDFSVCEVFTSVPAHLDKDGSGVIAWHCRITPGRFDFAYGESEAVDMKTVTDYQFILPFARMKIGAETAEAYQKEMQVGLESGKIKRAGDGSKAPPELYAIHNDLADITA